MTKEEQNKEEKQQNLKRYEIIYLISNKYSEDEVEPMNKDIVKMLKDNGSVIIAEENWGKRKLSYPIKHFYHAYYYLIECDLPAEKVPQINNYFRLDEKMLRHLIVQKRVKTAEEIAREQKAAQRIAKEQEALEKSSEMIAEIKAKEKEEKKTEVNIEELNKKLDKILDDTNDLL